MAHSLERLQDFYFSVSLEEGCDCTLFLERPKAVELSFLRLPKRINFSGAILRSVFNPG